MGVTHPAAAVRALRVAQAIRRRARRATPDMVAAVFTVPAVLQVAAAVAVAASAAAVQVTGMAQVVAARWLVVVVPAEVTVQREQSLALRAMLAA